jgi:hypothetical protein
MYLFFKKILLKRVILSEDTDSTLEFNAIYERKGLLLNERSNATMHSCGDIVNFLARTKQRDNTKYTQNKYQY